MKTISMRLAAAAALCAGLSAAAFAQAVGWDSTGGAGLLQPIRLAAARARAGAPGPRLEAVPIGGDASFGDEREAGAEHDLALSFRYTCGVSRAASCAPFCSNGGCGWDYPVVATVETPEGELGRYVADRDFVFPQLTVAGGKVLDGSEVVGTVDPLTQFIRPADGWSFRFEVVPAAGPNARPGSDPRFVVSVFVEKTAGK
ncbi:MAG TPA: hypothetical protein VH309_00170 [Elusimicrobiota bacterium]|jgi:hypothetical protein|nr:hypothetical protein [Elusimicrobiota bacterium]